MSQLESADITIMRLKKQPHDVIACFSCQGETHRLTVNLTSLVKKDDTNETIRDKIAARCSEQCDRQTNSVAYVDAARKDILFFSGIGSRVRARIGDINEREITWQYQCDDAWHQAGVRFTQKHDYLDYICPDGLSELGKAFIKMATRAAMKRLHSDAAAPIDVIARFVTSLPVDAPTTDQTIPNDMSWRLYLSGLQ
ncbi:hypothetical protein IH781_01430 [Patescibacteria group bacterium]|nr:hypothetical protein [Patescibacteria group bacterium]